MNKLWTLCKKSLYFFSSYLTQEDMSRFGRDYLQVGMYTEIMFPEHDVHFIAVNDGVDSTQGDNEFSFSPVCRFIRPMLAYRRPTGKKKSAAIARCGRIIEWRII